MMAARAERRRLAANPEHDLLARTFGNDEGAERPIPDGEREAQVAIIMDGIGGMVQLVVGRALQDAAGEAVKGDPHITVPQVAVGDEERHQENIAVEQGERANARTERVGHDAEHDAGRKPDQVHERDDLNRMLTQFGERRHDLSRMVDLVELPEGRDLVEAIMGEPIGQFGSQELEHRRERKDRPGRPPRGRVRPPDVGQAGDNFIAPEKETQPQHAVSGGKRDAVQHPQVHVDERRWMQKDAPGKDRAHEPAYDRAPAARPPSAGVVER
jgi:hypothetical protein